MKFITNSESDILRKLCVVKEGWYPNELGDGLDIKLPNGCMANLRQMKSFWKRTFYILNIWSGNKGLPVYSIKITEDDPCFSQYYDFEKIWESVYSKEKYQKHIEQRKEISSVHDAVYAKYREACKF